MKIERDERRFDFHGIGLAIKRAREASGMTQEQLGYIVDRDPRTIMYHENDGQHPSLNAFYQMVTMFGISVDEYHKAADALVELLDSAWLYDLRQKNEQEFNYWKPRHFAVELEDIGGLWEIIAQSVEIDSQNINEEVSWFDFTKEFKINGSIKNAGRTEIGLSSTMALLEMRAR